MELSREASAKRGAGQSRSRTRRARNDPGEGAIRERGGGNHRKYTRRQPGAQRSASTDYLELPANEADQAGRDLGLRRVFASRIELHHLYGGTSPLVRRRSLIPGPGELVFAILVPFILLGGRSALLGDPGTPWHLRLGRDILASGTVPRCDTLTFTRAGTPWVDQSWGFDVLLALIVDHAGWSAAVAFTAVLLASRLRGDGVGPGPRRHRPGGGRGRVAPHGGDRLHPLPGPAPHLHHRLGLPDVPCLPEAARTRGMVRRLGPGLHDDPGQPPRRIPGLARHRCDGGLRACDLGPVGRGSAAERDEVRPGSGRVVPGGAGESLRARSLPARRPPAFLQRCDER